MDSLFFFSLGSGWLVLDVVSGQSPLDTYAHAYGRMDGRCDVLRVLGIKSCESPGLYARIRGYLSS